MLLSVVKNLLIGTLFAVSMSSSTGGQTPPNTTTTYQDLQDTPEVKLFLVVLLSNLVCGYLVDCLGLVIGLALAYSIIQQCSTTTTLKDTPATRRRRTL